MIKINIKFVRLDNIDYENDNVINRGINVSDAEEYIKNLVNDVLKTDKKREYDRKDASLTMDKVKEIVDIYITSSQVAATTEMVNNNQLDYYASSTNDISNKLCQEQSSATNKYGHLTKIQKGSLVQALVENEGEIIYLACLIEHAKFIDENDLKYKIGLPSTDKATLKSCMVYHSSSGDVEKIYVTDSRTKFSEYWYDGFLELAEKRSDRTNTKEAFKIINSVMNNSLSANYKSDCTELNNALKVFFTQEDNFVFSDCLDFLFNKYKPKDTDLDIKELRKKIEERAEKSDRFDKVFTIDNTDIKSKLNNIKYTVTDNIEIKFKTPKINLKDYIYSTKIEDEQVLVIRKVNDDTYKKFIKENTEN